MKIRSNKASRIVAGPDVKAELAFAVRAEGTSLDIDVYDRIGAGGGLFGDGEGVTAKAVLSKLNASKNVKNILVRINSGGGLVDDGKAIYNLLRERSDKGAHVAVRVDGMAGSAASIISSAGDEITIAKNGFVFVHEARTLAIGRADHMAKTAKLLDRTNAQIAEVYADASARRGKNKTAEFFRKAMADETYFDADEAVDVGLADATSEAVKIAASIVDISELENAPEALRNAPYVTLSAVVEKSRTQALIDAVARIETTPLDGERSESHAHRSEEESSMDLKKFMALLGLTEGADEAAVTAAISELRDPKDAPKSVMRMLNADTEARAAARIDDLQRFSVTIHGVTGSGSPEQAVMQINAWKAGSDSAGKLSARVSELEESTRVAELEASIQRQSTGDGAKLRPAQHEWARTNFSTAKSLDQWALSAPEARTLTVTEKTSAQSSILTALEQEVCRQTGVAEDDYIATRNAQQAFTASRAGA